MTLRLILIRHAKSSWDNPDLTDHNRDLNDRGKRDASRLGKWLSAAGYAPDVVLCSSARRTVETWKRIAPELANVPQVELMSALYTASPRALLTILAGRDEETVMIIGHNPTIGEVADALVISPPDHPKFHQYPTGAISVVDFDIDDWAGVTSARGKLVDFVVPKDLK